MKPEDLTQHECLGFAHWVPRDEWQFTNTAGVHSVRVASRFSIDNGQALRTAALEGLGIILQLEDLLRDDLASGRLVRILPDYEPPSRPMSILFAPDPQADAETALLHRLRRCELRLNVGQA